MSISKYAVATLISCGLVSTTMLAGCTATKAQREGTQFSIRKDAKKRPDGLVVAAQRRYFCKGPLEQQERLENELIRTVVEKGAVDVPIGGRAAGFECNPE